MTAHARTAPRRPVRRSLFVRMNRVVNCDRPRLWASLSKQLDVYDDYQSKVGRRIELVRLRPRDDVRTGSSAT